MRKIKAHLVEYVYVYVTIAAVMNACFKELVSNVTSYGGGLYISRCETWSDPFFTENLWTYGVRKSFQD